MAVEKETGSLDLYESQDSSTGDDQVSLCQFSQHFHTASKPSGGNPKLVEVNEVHSAPPAPLSFYHSQVVADETESNRSHCKRKRAAKDYPLYSSVMERAKEFQSNLEPGKPSFVKFMLPSHATHGFLLGLPRRFSNSNLPEEDRCITLVDHDGKEHKTKYLVEKSVLSSGWKGFSIEHNVVEGDALVFQLIEATKFKVYIIRANDLAEVDGAPCLPNSGTIPMQIVDGNNAKASLLDSVSKTGSRVAEQFEDDSEEAGSDVVDIIDSQLQLHVRVKYYYLCGSQKGFLHGNLLKGINCELTAGIISEIVNVADAIRACNLTTTSLDDLESWDKILKAFELLGMKVGFLRARLRQILNLTKSQGAMDRKMYNEARTKRASLEEEMRNLETKLMDIKATHANYNKKVESLKSKAETYEMEFQSEVQAPW